MIKIEAVVPAAGVGRRFKQRLSKPFVRIGNIPIFVHTLKALLKCPFIYDIIVVVEAKRIKEIRELIEKFRLRKIKIVVAGGATRKDSVRNGLRFVDNDTRFVLIHDCARPFVDKQTIFAVINKAKRFGAAIAAVPIKSTLKRIKYKKHPIVETTLNRKDIYEIQTPQVFKREIILKAYKKFKNTEATDDASLVEKLGVDVYVVKGSDFNIKITTPEDIILAGAILNKRISH